MTKRARPAPKVDRAAMKRAVADFLRAAGLDAKTDPNLRETPERVTAAWADEFLKR